MEVKIGIQNIPRELVVETNVSAQDLEQALTQAMTSEDGGLSDVEQRRVGFGNL